MNQQDLLSQLPPEFVHEIVHFEAIEDGCKATIRCNCSSEDDFAKWISSYGKLSFSSWNVRQNYQMGSRLRYRKDYICRLSNRRHKKSPGPRCLARNCSASIIVKVKIDSENTRFGKRADPFVKMGLCGVVELDAVHSHPIENAHALSLLRPTADQRSRFVELFQQGHSVSEAIKEYIVEIELQFGDDETRMAASNIVPPGKTVSYWYSCWRNGNFGTRDGVEMWDVLDEKISEYEKCGAIVKVQRNPRAVAVITPIMQRAHRLPSAGEIVFVDSTSSCDDGHHVLTFLFAKCPIGAVPIGVVITTGTSTDDYRAGFSLFRDAIGTGGFNGRKEPAVFMTDDSDAERKALEAVWPDSNRLLCLFHVSQAVWRWLRSSDNGIQAQDRKILMKEFRAIIYAMTVEESEEKFTFAYFQSVVGQRYSNWLRYILSYWVRREFWCLAHRKLAALRGSHTNNYVEVAIRLFKDIVLSRTKAFNAIALVDFVVSIMEGYYEKRILRFSLSRDTRNYLLLEAVLKKSAGIVESDVAQLDEDFYSVKSQSIPDGYYYVDIIAGSCSCPAGTFGAFCKHQAALYRLKRIRLPSLPAFTGSDRHLMAILARGSAAKSPDFYRGLEEEMDVDSASTSTRITIADHQGAEDTDQSSNNPLPSSVASDGVVDENDPAKAALPPEDVSRVDRLALARLKKNLCRKLGNALEDGWKDSEVVAGAKKFLKRLDLLKTTSQLASALNTFGSTVGTSKYSGKKIGVQPTSIQRRRPCVTRGTVRLPGGRISGTPRSTRKRHSLASNIEQDLGNN